MAVKKIFQTADWQFILNKKESFDHAFNLYIEEVKDKSFKLDYDEVLQIIVGDIFENIGDLVKIDEFLYVKEMFYKMQSISPLLIVGGNHDNKKNNALDENDNLLKIINNWDWAKKNLRFFNYSIYNNSNPPEDHHLYINQEKINIGLYHDPLNCAIDYGGKDFKSSPALDIFTGLDAVMMGDIHKRQSFEFEKGKYAVYSGSPYQRRISESVNEHGYVLWKINDSNIAFEFCDIENPYVEYDANYEFETKKIIFKNKV